jgi:RimJ/RimL family protein N-acetyltransferase
MRLRPATPDDARAIAEVHVRTWKAAYPGLLPQDYLDALRPEDRLGLWEEALASEPWPLVLVAEDDGRVVGFTSVGPTRDEDLHPGVVGEVQTVYLDPEHWGRGAGATILEAATDELRNAGFATAMLWVLDVNERARGFYEHLGWGPDGATKRHDWQAFVATDVRYTRALD